MIDSSLLPPPSLKVNTIMASARRLQASYGRTEDSPEGANYEEAIQLLRRRIEKAERAKAEAMRRRDEYHMRKELAEKRSAELQKQLAEIEKRMMELKRILYS